jgi:excisionase family DNA binding protein
LIIPESITTLALNDRYFDLKGLSEYAAIGLSTLRAMIRREGLPHYRLPGRILIKQSEFDRWMTKFRQTTTEDLNAIVSKGLQVLG